MSSTALTVLVIVLVVGSLCYFGKSEGMDSRLFPGLEGFIGSIPGMAMLRGKSASSQGRKGQEDMANASADTALDRRRRKKRNVKVIKRNPCEGQEPSSAGMYTQNPEGATPAVCGTDKYTNTRGTHPVVAVSGNGARYRQLQEISDKRRQGMGVEFNPGAVLKKQLQNKRGGKKGGKKGRKLNKKRGNKKEGLQASGKKPLQNQDFLGANVGHVVMPELLPKRLGVQDVRGTPYIRPNMGEFAGGGGMESIITDYDTEFVGLTRL